MTRLEPIVERRLTGYETDARTGERKPVTVPYVIGHGQQLARQRLAIAFATTVPAAGEPGRQVRRRKIAKGAKKLRARVQATADTAVLKAARAARRTSPYSGPRASVLTPGHKRDVTGFDFAGVDMRKFLNSSISHYAYTVGARRAAVAARKRPHVEVAA